MSKTLSNRAHVTDTSLAFAAKNTSACIQGIRDGNFGGVGGGDDRPPFSIKSAVCQEFSVLSEF